MAHVANVTIDNTKVAADLTDYVLFIDLSDLPASFWSTVANGGGDIRVYKSDGTTELAREVVFCDTVTDTGELHVKFSGTLSSTVDTVIQIHADGTSSEPAFTATYGRNAVWSNFIGVYHLQEDPSGTAPQMVDSTGNGYDLTTVGSMASGDSVAGKLSGKGLNFNGTDQAAEESAFATMGGSSESVVCWAKPDTTSDGGAFWKVGAIYPHSTVDDGYSLGVGNTNFDTTGNNVLGLYESLRWITTGDTAGTAWGMYHFVLNASGYPEVYQNGVSIYSDVTGAPNAPDTDFSLGGYNPNATARAFDGDMDEVRVINSILSSSWITTEYNNQNSPSTFYSTEAAYTGTLTAILTIDNTKVSADLTDFVITVDLSDLPATFWSSVANGGGDIRVFKSDDTTELAREIVACDTVTDTGEMHVKFSGTLSSTVDTDIHIYTNGTSADYAVTDTYGRNAVWSAYNTVWHFNEASGNLVDSTGNSTSNTARGSATYAVSGTNFLTGIELDGTSDDFQLSASSYPSQFDLRTGGSITTALVGHTLNRHFLGISHSWTPAEGLRLNFNNPLGLIFGSTANYSGGTMSINTEHVVHYTYNDTTDAQKAYVDGTETISQTFEWNAMDTVTGSALGSLEGKSQVALFDGVFFEMRVTTTTLSADFVTTEKNNLSSPSTFYSAASGAATYTLTAAVGSFVLTSVDTAFQKAWKMAAAVGSFTLTGIAITFARGKGFVASLGTFTLTSQDTAFRKAISMTAAVGSFTLTGVASVFTRGVRMVAGTGSFIVTSIGTFLKTKPWGRTGRNTGIWTRSTKNDDE